MSKTSRRYIATLPSNPGFNGSTDGITFVNGRGTVDITTIDPRLGLSVDEVVKKLEQAGYQCEVVKDEATGIAIEVAKDGADATPKPEAEGARASLQSGEKPKGGKKKAAAPTEAKPAEKKEKKGGKGLGGLFGRGAAEETPAETPPSDAA